MRLSDAQLLAWLQSYVWVFVRVGAALMVAPVFGAGQTPVRVRMMLALALTVLLTPLLPERAALVLWSSGWWLQLGQQLLIGVALGLVLRLCFEAVMVAGSLIANSMGLGFAQLADPINGSSTPVIGQFMTVLAVLFFLALDGHLRFIQLLSDSLQTLPPGGPGLGAAGAHRVSLAGLQIFAGAIQLALPATIALLLANLAFGVMSRSAPALNLMTVGMPLSLLVGLLLLQYSLPGMQSTFSQLLQSSWETMDALSDVRVR